MRTGFVMLLTCVVAGCGGTTEGDASDDQAIQAEALGLVPSESMEDWVSYADAVVVLEVDSDAEIAATPDEVEAGEGATGRTVTVTVRDELWERDGAPAVPDSFEFETWGWAFRGDERIAMGQSSGSPLEVGSLYLVPVAEFEVDGWAPIGPDLTFAWDSGEAQVEGRSAAGSSGQLVDGRSRAEMIELLESTEPDPLAVDHGELGPADRYQAVVDDQREASPQD